MKSHRKGIAFVQLLSWSIILILVYIISGRLILSFNLISSHMSPFWPGAGIGIFFILKYGWKMLSGVFIGQSWLAFELFSVSLDELQIEQILVMVSWIANSCFFVTLSGFLIKKFTHYQGQLLEKTNIPLLLILAGPISALIPTLIGIYFFDHPTTIENNLVEGLMCWLGNSFSVIIALPLLLLIFEDQGIQNSHKIIFTLVIIFLLSAILVIFKYTEQQQANLLKVKLTSRGHELAQEINHTIQRHIFSARQLSHYFIEDKTLSLAEFQHFSRYFQSTYPSIRYLQWGELVNQHERSIFNKNMQVLYHKTYTIREQTKAGNLIISPDRTHYYPIKFAYPYTQQAVLGVDPTVVGGVLNDVLIAIETANPGLSYHLANQPASNHLIKMFALTIPFYRSSKSVQLLGYLILQIDGERFFNQILKDRFYRTVYLTVTDQSTDSSQLLYKTEYTVNDISNIYITHSFALENKLWQITLQAKYPLRLPLNAYYPLLIGLFITMAVIITLLLLISKQKQCRQLIEHKKNIIKESESYQNLLSATFNTHQAILITNPDYNIIRVNQAFCDIMGYSEMEVIGENPRMFASGRQSTEFYQNMWDTLLTTGRYEGEIWNRRKNGEIFPEYQTITEIKNAKKEIIYYISVFSDITKLKQNEEKIRHQAFYDQLTLLPNKMLFIDRLEQELAYTRRFGGIGALFLIDIDDFKQVNDLLGHHLGDDVLIELAKRLTLLLRGTDTVAHLGGDDFIVFMPVKQCDEQTAKQHATLVAEKILFEAQLPFIINEENYYLTASIGISFIKKTEHSATDLIRQTESALYRAKITGKNCFKFFQKQVEQQTR